MPNINSSTLLFASIFSMFMLSNCGRFSPAEEINSPPAILLSQELLASKKAGEDGEKAFKALAALDPNKLALELNNKEKQLAFWVNVYNGMVQHFLTTQPELWKSRNSFFSGDRFTIAGKLLSLEDVEHGIIRGGENKLGLGFIPQLFPGKFNRTFKIKGGDPRVHFALNCGAIDCPPVEIYDPKNINERLDYRSRVYLNAHSQLSEDGTKLTTTPLVSWFRGDFGTYGGVKDFFVHFGILTETDKKKVSLSYKDYDWTLATDVWAKD